jgi:hypothetical protein
MRSAGIRVSAARISKKTVPEEGLSPAFGRDAANIAAFLLGHKSCSLKQLVDLAGNTERLGYLERDRVEKFAQNGGKKTQNGFSFVGNSV